MKKPAKKPIEIPPPEPTKLVLITPALTQMTSQIEKAIKGCEISAIIFQFGPIDIRSKINLMKEMLPNLQSRGIACLIADEPEIATKSGADGIHVRDLEKLEETLRYRPAMMVTVGSLSSFDDAMSAGEKGADAVLFGHENLTKRLEILKRWAEIFETPCLGLAESFEEIAPLAQTKCEFIALAPWVFASESPNKVIKEALGLIA